MPYTTQFLQFGEDVSPGSIESNAEYAANSQRQGGLVPGIADPLMHNKLFQQLARVSNALTQAMANKLVQDVVDDGDASALVALFASALGPKHNAAASNPTAGDDIVDGYTANSRWLNTSTKILFICVSNTAGAAVWAPLAPIDSPTLTGTPAAPTPASNDNTTKIATTAFVSGAVSAEATARTTAINTALDTAQAAIRNSIYPQTIVTASYNESISGNGTLSKTGSYSATGASKLWILFHSGDQSCVVEAVKKDSSYCFSARGIVFSNGGIGYYGQDWVPGMLTNSDIIGVTTNTLFGVEALGNSSIRLHDLTFDNSGFVLNFTNSSASAQTLQASVEVRVF